jgi:HlyD family secretion protein
VNSSIFRKISLERLSSPEQLDEAYRVTTPIEWVGLIGVIILLGAAVVWSIEGSIATKVTAQGVIIRRGGVMNVVASGSGIVLEVDVKPGEHVTANQVVAKIAQPGLTDRIKMAEAALADARRERERTLTVRGNAAKLQIDALARERTNHEREIEDVRAQAKIVAEQIPVDDQLLAKGLITKQQTLAAKEKLVALEGQIAALQAQIKQIDAQQFNIRNQPLESDASMKARVTELERNLASLESELSTSANVVSAYSGQVVELKVYRGSPVSEGAPVISIQPDVDALELLVYLNSARAKDVKPGMEAEISPGTVRREEYGFLQGHVTFVADYPATPASMMRNLENESLAQALSTGPVTELRIDLERAPTPSGFRWSSLAGPPLTLSSGTLCSAMIVTRKQQPITLVLPAVRKMLGTS